MNKDLQTAKKTIQTEINALKKLYASFNNSNNFSKAVNLISKTTGKVFVIGVGKSYIVGSKVSSTLSSLGTPSVAFNATDLLHGGLGCIDKNNDALLIFSVSGDSSELDKILRYSNRHSIPSIGVSCKVSSMLLRFASIKILLPKVMEAGHSLAPTSSQINFLSWGDSLAIALMKRKKFTNKKFLSNHPSGTLASALILVKEIMAKGKDIPIINSSKNMKEAIKEMTKKRLGLVICKNSRGLISCIVDGDLRRASNNLYKKKIEEVSTKNPVWISEDATALSAINKMTSLKISSLLVSKNKDIKKKNKKVVGVLTILHCLREGIK